MTRSFQFIILYSLLSALCSSPAEARNRSSGKARSGGSLLRSKSFSMGLNLTPMVGYESNFTLGVGDSAQGSGVVQVDGGVNLEYLMRPKLRLAAEFNAQARLPFSGPRLTEFLAEVPLLLFYRPTPALELFISNHVAVERGRTSPVFSVLKTTADDTPTYVAIYETIRPALAYHLFAGMFAELGAYFRYKSVTQSLTKNADPNAEDSYQLMDIGADLSVKYSYKDRVSARVRVDYARRMFPGAANLKVRNPDYSEFKGASLSMHRIMPGLYLRGRIWGPLSLHAEYAARVVKDNKGYYSYLDHLVGGGLELNWPDVFELTGAVTFQKRGYSNRTDCVGGKCSASAERQVKKETALMASVRAAVTITEWLQGVVIYEMEDADTDMEDPLAPVHRILGGASLVL